MAERPTPQVVVWGDRDTASFCRVRPVLENERGLVGGYVSVRASCDSSRDVVVDVPGTDISGTVARVTSKVVTLDWCFGETSVSSEVYSAVVSPLVRLAAGGATATVLAYGQTSAGKSFTMSSVIDLAAREVFLAKSDTREVRVTVVEILGNDVRDLASSSGQRVEVAEDRFGAVVMRGAGEVTARSSEELVEVTERSMRHRMTVETARNQTGSSRSHAVVRMRMVETDPEKVASGVAVDGLLFLCDLAGSERQADREEHSKERLAESKLINSSLMTLKECIKARSSGGRAAQHVHIPYRASKLTLILRDCFDLAVTRPSKLAVIACLSPLARDVNHSENTLRYAKELTMAAKTAVVPPDPSDPVSWSGEKARQWLQSESHGDLGPTDILQTPSDNGRTLSELSEDEFLRRATSSGKFSDVRAHKLYSKLWAKVADSRTNQRKKLEEQRQRVAQRKKLEADFDSELVKRLC